MLLIKSSNRLWDHILSYNPTHLSILTYGVQRTVLGHSKILCELLTNKKTRVIVCPNNGLIPPCIKYRETDSCHTKCIIAHRNKEELYWITSMNLEIGLWENFLYQLSLPSEKQNLLTHFNTKWESSYDPTPLPTFDHLLKNK